MNNTKNNPRISAWLFRPLAALLGVLLLAAVSAPSASAALRCDSLRCEYLNDPLGLDAANPRLGWIVASTRRGETQTAYQILVASSLQLLNQNQGDLWDTGKVASDDTSQIVYSGKPLSSRQSCFWKVRSWDRDGTPGDWSQAARWQMGLLAPSDWSAHWITAEPPLPSSSLPLVIQHASYEAVDGPGAKDVTALIAREVKNNRINLVINNRNLGGDPALNLVKRLRVEYELGGQSFKKEIPENQALALPEEPAASRYLRKSFTLNSSIQHAVLYATALGLYEAHINGQRVGDHVLAPDWTDYRKRVRYQAYDVTALLKRGDNAIGALAGQRLVHRPYRQRRLSVLWQSARLPRPARSHLRGRPHRAHRHRRLLEIPPRPHPLLRFHAGRRLRRPARSQRLGQTRPGRKPVGPGRHARRIRPPWRRKSWNPSAKSAS